MKKSTQELLELLNSTKDIKTYLNAQEASLTPLPLHELIEIFLDKKRFPGKNASKTPTSSAITATRSSPA